VIQPESGSCSELTTQVNAGYRESLCGPWFQTKKERPTAGLGSMAYSEQTFLFPLIIFILSIALT
jgi:hypothetical protein